MRGPRVLQRLDALGEGRASAMGGFGDLLIGQEAKPVLGVVEAPKKRLQHRQRLRRDDAIGPALLGPAAQVARPRHDRCGRRGRPQTHRPRGQRRAAMWTPGACGISFKSCPEWRSARCLISQHHLSTSFFCPQPRQKLGDQMQPCRGSLQAHPDSLRRPSIPQSRGDPGGGPFLSHPSIMNHAPEGNGFGRSRPASGSFGAILQFPEQLTKLPHRKQLAL
jgi:hypothetical protein